MINFKPVPFTPAIRRSLSAAPAGEPPPMPDFLYTGYTGVAGVFETLAVITVAGAAAWVGICTGTKKKNSTLVRSAGWVGGVGSAVIGALYLATKSGLNDYIGLPSVRISPS